MNAALRPDLPYDAYRDFVGVAQIGYSTISIFKTLYHCIKHGHNVIYTLPTDTDADKFAKSKTNLIISNNPSLSTPTLGR